MKYKPIVREYCTLSIQSKLTETEANRLGAILQQAEQEPMLNLLLDEADHLVAHELDLIDPVFIQEQQHKLKVALQLERFKKANLSQTETVEIQTVLQKEGLYTGAIDGVCGPRTQEAIKQLRSLPTNRWIRNFISAEIWSTC
ncbi:peptidoglycan-binding protein [Microcoleus sp. FACHB-1515]|uniref:peptidoglycan-binding domain-containing protein n=2 Tax=Cyanophyceae TaxID=3028117 RepID=UPI001686774F|nr:peptidoglycan-binding domain-containing protein [Microcoleus sp. FACHB-1515]